MTDQFGREINYMRVSITDRCNLRCTYCMPRGVAAVAHGDVLSYEEILRVCEAATALGITRFKVTGGEPLARRGAAGFIARLKALSGAEQVTLTTNGLLLDEHLDELAAAGLGGINLSLDTLDDDAYAALTGTRVPVAALAQRLLDRCAALGIPTKINTVLLAETFGGITGVAALAQHRPVDARFIELMPIGEGAEALGVPMAAALARLKERWPGLTPADEQEPRGNGPAVYYAAPGLTGRIGFITALSHSFCESCNRVRLTSTGQLKPCLCSGEGADLRALLRGGAGNDGLRAALEETIYNKPAAHCFAARESITEHRTMNEIGG